MARPQGAPGPCKGRARSITSRAPSCLIYINNSANLDERRSAVCLRTSGYASSPNAKQSIKPMSSQGFSYSSEPAVPAAWGSSVWLDRVVSAVCNATVDISAVITRGLAISAPRVICRAPASVGDELVVVSGRATECAASRTAGTKSALGCAAGKRARPTRANEYKRPLIC